MSHTMAVCEMGVNFLVGRILNRSTISATLGLMLAALSCAPAAASNPIFNLSYPSPGSPGNVQYFDLFIPDAGVPDSATIILAHGGGYSGGDKNELIGLCSALADRGYVVISTNYRLVTAAISGPGQGSFPQPGCDILNAVHWVRDEGQALGLPSRVIVGGFSAGSTIALNAAMGAGGSQFNTLPPAGPRGYTIDGAIGAFGRYDLAWNAQTFGLPGYVNAYLGLGSTSLSPGAGGSITQNAVSVFAAASAVTFTNNCSPPTVLFHGDADGLVPVGNSYRLQQSLTNAAAPVLVHIVPGGGHTNAILGPTEEAQAQSLDIAAQWIFQHQQVECGRTAPPPPPAPGSCCTDNGVCSVTIQALCQWEWTQNAACLPNPCVLPNFYGACCSGATCQFVLPGDCVGPGTHFIGAFVACNEGSNFSTPCCKADFNHDGHVEVSDVFMFLNAWFAADPRCIVDDAPVPSPTVGHIFMFLNAWFGGC